MEHLERLLKIRIELFEAQLQDVKDSKDRLLEEIQDIFNRGSKLGDPNERLHILDAITILIKKNGEYTSIGNTIKFASETLDEAKKELHSLLEKGN